MAKREPFKLVIDPTPETTEFVRPISAHHWLEQFKSDQFVVPPDKIRERMATLKAALKSQPLDKAASGWFREYHWRVQQLKALGFTEEPSVFS